MLDPDGAWEAMCDLVGPENVMPVSFLKEHNKQYIGLRLSEIAEQRGQDWFDAAVDLLADEGQRISTIYFAMDEENVKIQLQQPWNKVSTDAGGMDPAWAKAAARSTRAPTAPGPACPRQVRPRGARAARSKTRSAR